MKELLKPALKQVMRVLPKSVIAEVTTAGLETYKGKGRVPYPVFIALGGVAISSTLEVVPLRSNPMTGKVEALLAQRPDTDKFWPGQWHVAGSSLLVTDEVDQDELLQGLESEHFNPVANFKNPAKRLIDDEYAGTISVDDMFLVEARFRRGLRSTELTAMLGGQATLLGAEAEIPGQFFEVNNLATNPPEGGLIVGHLGLVRRAAAMYSTRQNY